jgi:hypothetical protein
LDPSEGYDFTETGNNPYTRTEIDNANDGQQSTTETGTDTYSINGTSGTFALVELSLTGTDTYTMTGSLNTQTGGFSLTTSGSGTSSDGDTSFTTTESGDTRDGSVTSSNTGTNRYDLLGGINNTADGANGDIGMADFSPVGMPIYVGRSSTPSGMFSSVGDDQYQYCFAKGTMIRMADGSTKAIETIEPRTMVPASPERDPGGGRSSCDVLEVYHNSPVGILNLTVSSSLDPLNGDVIRTTGEHPFYVEEKGWTKAKDLIRGDRLWSGNGDSVKVKNVAYSGSIEPVFNLRIATHHTYYVVTSSGYDVLVHNTSQQFMGVTGIRWNSQNQTAELGLMIGTVPSWYNYVAIRVSNAELANPVTTQWVPLNGLPQKYASVAGLQALAKGTTGDPDASQIQYNLQLQIAQNSAFTQALVAGKNAAGPTGLGPTGEGLLMAAGMQVVGGVIQTSASLNTVKGFVGEYNGYAEALDRGEIGIQAPQDTHAPGPDYITLRINPDNTGTVIVYDAKYANGPSSLSASKLSSWRDEVIDAVFAMRPGPLRDTAIQAIEAGRIEGAMYFYKK